MAAREHWQMDASAPELYERYLVPAITSIWVKDLLDRTRPTKGEVYSMSPAEPASWCGYWMNGGTSGGWLASTSTRRC